MSHYLWSKGCFWYCVFNPWVTNPVFLNNIVIFSGQSACGFIAFARPFACLPPADDHSWVWKNMLSCVVLEFCKRYWCFQKNCLQAQQSYLLQFHNVCQRCWCSVFRFSTAICCNFITCAKDIHVLSSGLAQLSAAISLFVKDNDVLSPGLAQLSFAISQCLQKIFMFCLQV